MSGIMGRGAYAYRPVEGWAKWPEGWDAGDVAAVGVDRQDNVYAFNRGPHPMVVFDRDGNFLRSWGEGVFRNAHGVHMGPDDTIWLTDDGDHTVRKCTLDGKVLLTIGIPGTATPYMSGEPFNRCTHTALSPQGDIFVSDGYGNARVHKYSPDGRLLLSWGGPGTRPGEFNIPHNITCDADGWVYVADRENHRVQVFDGNGKYETQWNNLHRPSGLYMTPGKCPLCYIAELGPHLPVNRDHPNIGPRISVLDSKGELLARVEETPARGTGPGQFISPHGMCVDSRGALYVGEVAYTSFSRSFPNTPKPARIRCLQKLEKVDA
ncbi:MAG: peptidyl-alpha-hydroxyglycine alpha-amidating lyase family protein [Acetobacteraceae bacterium]